MHVFYTEEVSTTAKAPVSKNDTPSNFEHVSEEMRNDIGVVCFLLKIRDTLVVGLVFSLVCCRSKRDVDVFASDPFVEVIFNLKVLRRQNYSNDIPKT